MACILPLAPPSITILELDDVEINEQEWREFFGSHPEVHTIKSPQSSMKPVPESLWGALSPAGTDEVPLCPKLDSISISEIPAAAPLLSCLRNRKHAGFGLRHLEFGSLGGELIEEFRRLVEVLGVDCESDDLWEMECVRPVSTND